MLLVCLSPNAQPVQPLPPPEQAENVTTKGAVDEAEEDLRHFLGSKRLQEYRRQCNKDNAIQMCGKRLPCINGSCTFCRDNSDCIARDYLCVHPEGFATGVLQGARLRFGNDATHPVRL